MPISRSTFLEKLDSIPTPSSYVFSLGSSFRLGEDLIGSRDDNGDKGSKMGKL
jgi:hypothetical protein